MSVGGIAPQSTTTNGLVARAASCAWIARARSSLPVPLSPSMSTVRSVRAARSSMREEVAHRRRAADRVAEAIVRAERELDRVGLDA